MQQMTEKSNAKIFRYRSGSILKYSHKKFQPKNSILLDIQYMSYINVHLPCKIKVGLLPPWFPKSHF